MLNFMEYWTGDMLSDHVTQVSHFRSIYNIISFLHLTLSSYKILLIISQENMIEFWKKLIVILLESKLNKIKGKPIYCQPSDKEHASNSDCTIVEGSNIQNLYDGAQDQSAIPVHNMPMDQRGLIHELCKHITSIKDASALE
jgi:hypothetical protein